MADSTSPPTKKRGHSYWSFLWTAAKMAKKRAWTQLGNLLVIVSLVQFGLLADCISKITKGIDVNFWLTFSPVIISVFGFLAFLFRAAHKIYERALNSEQSNGKDVPENEPPKPAMFVVFIAVTLGCVGLVITIITEQKTQIEQLRGQIPPPVQLKPIIASKPLPDKIILSSEPPPPSIVSTQQVASMESQKQFETNPADLGDAESELAKSRAEKLANLQKGKLKAETMWTNNLPIYVNSLESLYYILTEEAKKQGDGIAKTVGYFQCLPSTITHEIGEMNVSEIRFQTKTNMDFKIAITGEEWAGEYIVQSRGLKIYCSCGFLAITPRTIGNGFGITVRIPDGTENKYTSISDAHNVINQNMKILVGAQIDYLSKTNDTP